MGFVFALFYPFLIIIYALLAGALFASLIVFINNMRNGVANKWPTKNLVGAIIAGIIFVMALTTTMIVIYHTTGMFSMDNSPNSSSSINAAIALMAMNLQKGVIKLMMSGLAAGLGNLIMLMCGILLIPAFAAFIVLLVKCIKHKWTRRLLAPFIVISVVITIIIFCEVSYYYSMMF